MHRNTQENIDIPHPLYVDIFNRKNQTINDKKPSKNWNEHQQLIAGLKSFVSVVDAVPRWQVALGQFWRCGECLRERRREIERYGCLLLSRALCQCLELIA